MIERNWGPGDKAKWSDHGTVYVGQGIREQKKLIWGEYPYSRQDNNHYVIYDGPGEEPIGFSGHRPLVDVVLRSYNYLKDSDISGAEIRAGGEGKIFVNELQCYSFFYRNMTWALLQANILIEKILNHPLRYWDIKEENQIIGRQIFYRELECHIIRLMRDQGCVIIARPNFALFPAPVYSEDRYDQELELKIDIVEPTENVWWYSKNNAISRATSQGLPLEEDNGVQPQQQPPGTTSEPT